MDQQFGPAIMIGVEFVENGLEVEAIAERPRVLAFAQRVRPTGVGGEQDGMRFWLRRFRLE